MRKEINNISCVGSGTIGAGWIARLLVNKIKVKVYDLTPFQETRLKIVIENTKSAYKNLFPNKKINFENFEYYNEISPAVENADLVIESVPERLDIKQEVFKKIEEVCSKRTIIASSTSGIKPTDLQKNMQNPERLMVTHPFNPVYLIPLVEVVGGTKTKGNFIKSRLSQMIIFILNFNLLRKLLLKEKPDFLIAHLIISLPLILFFFFKFETKLIIRI